MCVCKTESLCCTPETNNTLWFKYTSIKKKKTQLKLSCSEPITSMSDQTTQWHRLGGIPSLKVGSTLKGSPYTPLTIV